MIHLHLLDTADPQATAITQALIHHFQKTHADAEHRLVVIGDRAAICHPLLKIDTLLPGPATGIRTSAAWAGPVWSALRRADSPVMTAHRFHAWGFGLGMLLAAIRDRPRLTIHLTQSLQPLHRLAIDPAAVAAADARWRAWTPVAARELFDMAVPRSRIDRDLPTDLAWDGSLDRQTIRDRWRIDEKTHAVALLGDPPDRADALMGAWATGLAHFAGLPIRLIAPENALDLHRVTTITAGVQPIAAPVARWPFDAIAAADLALVCDQPAAPRPDGPARTRPINTDAGAGLSPYLAAHAGLPVIAEHTPATAAFADYFKNRPTIRLIGPHQPARLAAALLEMLTHAPADPPSPPPAARPSDTPATG